MGSLVRKEREMDFRERDGGGCDQLINFRERKLLGFI